jgi:hypothetical protein
MNESTIDVVVLGVMRQRTDLGHTKAWVDVARSDGDERDYVSVPLPASDFGLSRALKLAGRRQMRLRVPVTFFDGADGGRLMALRDALQEERRWLMSNQPSPDEIPPGFDETEWKQAVADGRAIIVDGPPRRRFSGLPRVRAAITWFPGLTVRSFRIRLARRFHMAGGDAGVSGERSRFGLAPAAAGAIALLAVLGFLVASQLNDEGPDAIPARSNTSTATATAIPTTADQAMVTATDTQVSPTATATGPINVPATIDTQEEATSNPRPVKSPVPTETDTATAEPTDTPEPTDTATSESTNSEVPTDTATVETTDTATSEPTDTATPEPTETSAPSETPEPTETDTPQPTDTPESTDTATATDTTEIAQEQPTEEPTAEPTEAPPPEATQPGIGPSDTTAVSEEETPAPPAETATEAIGGAEVTLSE